jgi:hypothetical protein
VFPLSKKFKGNAEKKVLLKNPAALSFKTYPTIYIKELQFNARVSKPDPAFATLLLEQLGEPMENWRRHYDISDRHSVQKIPIR